MLASLVKESPCLYDPLDSYYKEPVVVKKTWDNVARMMGFGNGEIIFFCYQMNSNDGFVAL
jgi:hypothetical protein